MELRILCEPCLEAVNTVMAVKSFQAAVVDLNIKFSTWPFVNSGNPDTWKKCDNYSGDTYELEDPDDLLDIFPYGVFVADDTFATLSRQPYQANHSLNPKRLYFLNNVSLSKGSKL